MARPEDSYPDAATLGGREETTDGDGEVRLREALDAHGDRLAEAVESVDELNDALATAILVLASADDEEVERVTDSTANLVKAADGLTTEQAADLAADVGKNGDTLAETLDTLLDLQREGHLDDLVTIATAFSGSLSPDEVEELADMLDENGTDLVDALDVVLELHREDHLEDLVDLATVLSTLDIDQDTAEGLNTFLSAVGDAQRESEPVSLFGAFRRLRSRDARTGLGYLVTTLTALGRRLRER